MVEQFEIKLKPYPRGFHLVTQEILNQIGKLPEQGLMNLFIKHTSAALTINENADPAVRKDFETIMNKLIPENQPEYTHTQEGPDDMPSHVKGAMLGFAYTVPITNGQLNFGTWQGIYLCELRNHGSSRKIVATVYS